MGCLLHGISTVFMHFTSRHPHTTTVAGGSLLPCRNPAGRDVKGAPGPA
jgi:hypothetical protein